MPHKPDCKCRPCKAGRPPQHAKNCVCPICQRSGGSGLSIGLNEAPGVAKRLSYSIPEHAQDWITAHGGASLVRGIIGAAAQFGRGADEIPRKYFTHPRGPKVKGFVSVPDCDYAYVKSHGIPMASFTAALIYEYLAQRKIVHFP